MVASPLTLVVVIGASLACSLALTPLAQRLAWSFGAVSNPDGIRRLHRRATPLWGGLAVFLSMSVGMVVVSALADGEGNSRLVPVFVSAAIVCLLGICDDRRPLSAWQKLPIQLLATLPLVGAGVYVERFMLFGLEFNLGPLGPLATAGWLLLGINAVNLIDGMDGLASSIGVVVSISAAVALGLRGQEQGMLLALALAGALLGFLAYNRPPAGVFLGDSGSMLVGLLLAYLAMRTSLVGPRTMNLSVPGLLLFVPLLDTLLAVLRRLLERRSILCGDHHHLHHQLLDCGLGTWRSLGVLCGLCLVAAISGCTVAVRQSELISWGAVLVCVGFLWNLRLIGARETRLLYNWLLGLPARVPAPEASRAGSIAGPEAPTTLLAIAAPRREQPSRPAETPVVQRAA